MDSPEKLRIAFVTPEFVTENNFDGGLANYLNRVSRILAEHGHDIHVVTLSNKEDTEFNHHGVMVHRVVLRPIWDTLNRLSRYYFPTTLQWLNFSTQAYRKLKQLHRQKPFHVVQYPNYSFCGLFSMLLLRTKHIVRTSSFEPELHAAIGERNVDSRLVERLEKLQYKLTQNVYAPSRAMQQTLAEKLRVDETRLIRTPFYIETGDWDHSVYDQLLNDKKYILYFGRFELHKGFHTLAHALPEFLRQCRDAFVVLVGRDRETNLASSMAGFARSQCDGLADRLIMVGHLPHNRLYPIVSRARLITLPSLVDNLPNACLEAMGLGKVVIGTNGTGFEELITDGVNGFLVRPDDPNALAAKMISAWNDCDLDAMGIAAKREVEKFAPEKTISALLGYYFDVLQTTKKQAE